MNDSRGAYGSQLSAADMRTDALGAVSSLLWRERETLEQVLYSLTVERLIVESGNVRWLTTADEQVRQAAALLQDREVLRVAEVDVLARTMGLPSGTTLRELADLAAEPWCTIFADHRSALRDLVAQIDVLTTANRRLLQAGADAARESLDRIDRAVDGVGTYDARGEAVGAQRLHSVLDEHA